MNQVRSVVVLLMCFLIACSSSTRAATDSEDSVAEDSAAEDMEIFATIARENLSSVYLLKSSSHQTWVSQVQSASTSHGVGEPLYDYLDGYGITIQMKIPAPVRKTDRDEVVRRQKESRWDATKKRLSGLSDEKQTVQAPANQCTVCHMPSEKLDALAFTFSDYFHHFADFHRANTLSSWIADGLRHQRPSESDVVDAAISTLAEFGHRIRGLEPNERVTISLSHWRNSQPNESANDAGKGALKPTVDKSAKDADEEKSETSTAKELSEDRGESKGQNPIDDFVREQLAGPSVALQESAKGLFLDLTGRLPSADEQRLLRDKGYAEAIDRLLNRVDVHSEYRDFVVAALGRGVTRVPKRTRMTITATAQQLAGVASGKISRVEFAREVSVRIYRR